MLGGGLGRRRMMRVGPGRMVGSEKDARMDREEGWVGEGCRTGR